MKRLTEQQLRQVIRQELKNVLFEQEKKMVRPEPKRTRIIGSLLAALFMTALSGHEGGGIGDASAGGGGRTPTPQEILEKLGLSEE